MNFKKTIYQTHFLALALLSLLVVGCQDNIPSRPNLTHDQGQATGGSTGGDGGGGSNRPDNSVKFKEDFCGCRDGKAITFGNCGAFCSSKNTNGAGILYANFNVSKDISLNNSLASLKGWCNSPLPDDPSNPKCVMKAKDDENNEIILDVETGSHNNALKINIDRLAEDKGYVLTLVETSSQAKSDSIQIIKYSTEIPISTLGPLKNAPISQYTCLFRPASPDGDTGDIYFDTATRIHFYFLPRIPPNPVTYGSDFVCHDFMNPLYGPVDDALYPRLEQIPGIFNLWDTLDPRFYDNNGNANEDVNDIIIQKAKNFGATNISPSTKFFAPFNQFSPVADVEGAGGNTSSAQSMGYFMAPWIDTSTYRSYCLNSTHYSSSNPLFRAIGDIVGVDTEGIYVGQKAPETVLGPDNNPVSTPGDFILIRETDLKKVWFYLKNGVPTVPTDAIVASVAVYFYYPLNRTSPYVRSSTQRIYQIKSASELSSSSAPSGGSNPSGTSTNYPPHDRKIGCIPKF